MSPQAGSLARPGVDVQAQDGGELRRVVEIFLEEGVQQGPQFRVFRAQRGLGAPRRCGETAATATPPCRN
jgi:hypothetical protein